MADLSMVKVQKKGGDAVPYERDKVIVSVTSAGGTPDQAEQVAQGVDTWASSSESGTVASSDIRAKILEILQPINAAAAEMYRNYVKPETPEE